MWVENDVSMMATRYNPSIGAFGILGEMDQDNRLSCKRWHLCRDRFQENSNKIEKFWFVHGSTVRGENIAAFIDEFEKRLNIKTARRSKFGPTSRGTIMWVQWSPFWRQFSIRRSLFTALLRCGTTYKPGVPQVEDVQSVPDNFEQALRSCHYIILTKVGTNYFLQGNTVYTGPMASGWLAALKNATQANVTKLLRRPALKATP